MAKNIEDSLNKISEKLDDLQKSTHSIDKEVALQKAALESHLAHHEKLYEEYKRANDTLAHNTESLKEHMRRTDLIEKIVRNMDDRLVPLEADKVEAEAISEHQKDMLKKWGKIAAVIGSVIGILVAIKPFLLKLLSL